MLIGEMDRISQLPEFILHIILSKIDTKEAFRASVLSKRWYQAWSSIPFLDFQIKYFVKVKDIDSDYDGGGDIHDDDSYDDLTIERFLGFVDNIMQRYFTRKYRITKLNIKLPYVDEKIEPLIDKWISIAVQNQIQELDIMLPDNRLKYGLPEILFRAKSLKVLSCKMVELRYYETMELVSLECLAFISGALDEYMLQKILSLSPLVKLSITTNSELGKISLPWTREVYKGGEGINSGTMRYNLKTAPLKEFLYQDFEFMYQRSGSTSRWPWNMNMSALKNLKKLKIVAGYAITDDIISEIADGLVALESLEIGSWAVLKCIKISHISLKEIRIEVLDLKKITIDTPNLLEFWCWCDVEAHLSLIRAHDSCNTCFSPPWVTITTTDWFVKLKKFLKATNCFKSLFMELGNFEEVAIYEDELSTLDAIGSPYKLREVKLCQTKYRCSQSLLTAFLDALFWSCNPDVLSISFDSMPHEMVLDYLKRKVQCWKHPLKKIEVEGVDFSGLLSEPSELKFRFRLSWFSVES